MKPYYEQDGITIYHGDNCDVMGTLPKASVDLVVTSPPYDDLRSYGGHDWDFYGVAWNLKRLLSAGGIIVWIVSDATIDGSETGTSMKQALHFKRLGLRLHDTMIYKKSGSSPNIHHPRYSHCWEYTFIFSNGEPKTFNPHKKRRNSTVGVLRRPATKTQRNGEIKTFNVATKETPLESIELNIWEYLTGVAAGDEGIGDHPAYFPEALAKDHILSWSNPSDVVLDPFCGSGTTLKMAKLNYRHAIGIDIENSYCELASKRVAQGILDFGATA